MEILQRTQAPEGFRCQGGGGEEGKKKGVDAVARLTPTNVGEEKSKNQNMTSARREALIGKRASWNRSRRREEGRKGLAYQLPEDRKRRQNLNERDCAARGLKPD